MENTNHCNYRNPQLSDAERTADLLGRMTMDEKLAQMQCIWEGKAELLLDSQGNFDEQKATSNFHNGNGIGQIGRPSDAGTGKNAREMAELTNTIQQFFIANNRLGIPVIFHEECLHGHAAKDATYFPQPIGMAATFDVALIENIFAIAALEARSRGAHQALSPVLDVAREPRWGRVEETFGEDPFLVAQMGIAAVSGLQGSKNFRNKKNLIATLKHFAAHGQPESGNNCAPVNISERLLREVFLYPFQQVIQATQVDSVMASYNEIDGVPSHANRWLLRDVLRDEWGFEGYVVSDYHGITELYERPDFFGNYVAADYSEAASLATKAGVNIELPEQLCYLELKSLVQDGSISEVLIDELVSPMLHAKFVMGLFDDPYVDSDYAGNIVGSDENRTIAHKAALETITLLKNEGNIAPLNLAQLDTIAVIGPNANRELLGGYSEKPKQFITVLTGIKERVGDSARVLYSEGCKITVGGSWWQDEVIASDPEEDWRQIAEAVSVAQQADVVIAVVGGNEQTSREAFYKNHMGDRTSLDLVGRQEELVKALVATGKPVIVLLFNGRPLSINYFSQNIPTIFECWYLGQETGHAIAEVLFGDYNPGGKLPITIPRSVGHLPAYYNYKPAARRGYLFDEVSPLYPFGYGLSYTTFLISKPELTSNRITKDETTTLQLKVKNAGTIAGGEVVQLYIRDKVSSVTRPIKELKGFQRINLDPGEEQTVEFEISPALLMFWNIDMEYTVEPGEFDLLVGNSSRDEDLQQICLQVTE